MGWSSFHAFRSDWMNAWSSYSHSSIIPGNRPADACWLMANASMSWNQGTFQNRNLMGTDTEGNILEDTVFCVFEHISSNLFTGILLRTELCTLCKHSSGINQPLKPQFKRYIVFIKGEEMVEVCPKLKTCSKDYDTQNPARLKGFDC